MPHAPVESGNPSTALYRSDLALGPNGSEVVRADRSAGAASQGLVRPLLIKLCDERVKAGVRLVPCRPPFGFA